jgi:enamine deaminase RidA (YjgF/YER057c/UK114 family)
MRRSTIVKDIIEVPVLSEGVGKVGVPLSMVTRANGFVFVSGTPPFDLTTGKLVRGDIEVQITFDREGLTSRMEAPLVEHRLMHM